MYKKTNPFKNILQKYKNFSTFLNFVLKKNYIFVSELISYMIFNQVTFFEVFKMDEKHLAYIFFS